MRDNPVPVILGLDGQPLMAGSTPAGPPLMVVEGIRAPIATHMAALRSQDALKRLQELGMDADPRELAGLATQVDPWIVKHDRPNRKQRRAALARAAKAPKKVKRR